ncbi:MAG: hypothetical protein NXI13_04780 [Proteobacteria bacterium]|nr:hypothetical protein [Pseudomonadota bacterium]
MLTVKKLKQGNNHLWVFCGTLECQRAVQFTPEYLEMMYGADYDLGVFRKSLRCKKCGGKDISFRLVYQGHAPLYGSLTRDTDRERSRP